jgi:tetratricopeptide (TPR) repeat protein
MLAAAVVLLSAVRAAPAQTSAGQDAGVRVREAEVALRTGRYQEATSAFRRLVRQGEAYPVADRGLVRSLAAIGRYEEAEEAARASVAQHAGSAELQRVLGDVLVKRGDLEGAAAAYRAAVGGGASDRLSAELGQAMLLYDRGARDEALRRFEGFTADDLTSVALGLSYLGGRDPDFLRDALRVYDEAIAADPGYQRPRVLLGELFLAKYNSLDAGPMFQDVLQANPDHADALLGMARRAQFDGSSEALDLVRRSLGTNPNHVAARAFLSRLLLDLGDTRGAEEEAQRALEVNPNSLEALSILAAALHVRGDQTGYETVRQRALEINPRYADLFTTVGEVAVRNHLYRDAVTFGRRAVEQDPFSWSAYGLLGLNLLRTGEVEEGRAVLEASFAGDPFNPWVKNTLDLLDNLAGFDEVRSDRFRFFMDSGESDSTRCAAIASASSWTPGSRRSCQSTFRVWPRKRFPRSRPATPCHRTRQCDWRCFRATPISRCGRWGWPGSERWESASATCWPWTRRRPEGRASSTGDPLCGTSCPTRSRSPRPLTGFRAG